MVDRKDGSQNQQDTEAKADPGATLSQPNGRVYRITARGQLSDDWSDWFDGLQMTQSDNGNTVLSGTIVDQAALMGILNKLNRLNVTLLSLSQVEDTKDHERGKIEMSECAKSKHHCATCPIRQQAMAKPRSIFARIHRWHSGWNAGWKAYQAQLHARTSQWVD